MNPCQLTFYLIYHIALSQVQIEGPTATAITTATATTASKRPGK